jgi:hypothetical protein
MQRGIDEWPPATRRRSVRLFANNSQQS